MKKGLIVIALLVLVIVGGIVFYLFDRQERAEAPPVVALPVEPGPAQPAIELPVPEPPPFTVDEKRVPVDTRLDELPLPPLNESDGYVQENVAAVVGEATAMQYFAADGLASRAVATVDALGSRQVPGNIQAVAGPETDYMAYPDPDPPAEILDEQGDLVQQYLSDPGNSSRYNTYVEMIEAVDAEQFAALYHRNSPLFQQAWRELGYTDVAFDDRLAEVIDELLATPEVEEPYRLVKPEAVYLFADEELEALSAGQKIMLRMGSENRARVKSKLSEFRKAL